MKDQQMSALATIPNNLRGWPLWWLITLAIAAATLVTLSINPGYAGGSAGIRLTARTSFILFILAFTASSVARGWPGRFSRWQLHNRRYLGLAFAASHAIHLMLIVYFWNAGVRDYVFAQPIIGLYINIVGYAVITVMAATSFTSTRQLMSPRQWTLLHTLGGYFIWLSFAKSYLFRAATQPAYLPFAIVLIAALVLRWYARRLDKRADGY